MTKNSKETEQQSFEESLAQLETLVKSLEGGDLNLEEALKTFEQGIKLSQHCQQALQAAEQKVDMLVDEKGNLTTTPFPENDG